MTSVLQVRELRRSFGAVTAVDGVTFDIQPGEVVSIIGPNGSGKTSTLNLVSGVLSPDSGSIALAGRRIENATVEQIAEAGLARTFQNGRVFGTLTVAENVEVGAHSTLTALRPLRGLANVPVLRWISLLAELAVALLPTRAARSEQRRLRADVDQQIERFSARLGPRKSDPAYTLSYANRRRTEIARALAPQPLLLLLDEPTAGMNQTETAEVQRQLAALKAAGQTMLLVEHKLDLVMALSDRVLVMDDGAVIADGDPATVRRDPAVIEAYLGRRRERPARADRSDQSDRLEETESRVGETV
ncbi:ABC transporter ATP-binding protein [Nakamurella lactea]|uniref:ABC transporter ATP-binding protein n=1 Tax=Nakamurella lactea TaxID=459515 RepID=UPI00040D65EF|nr:ATP-binding cassette domain-containing protein [Nakamurella lactea]